MPDSISADSRQRLLSLRNLMLEQHKLLLELERTRYESANGAIAGPAAFLQLLMNDPAFAWLRVISGLVVEIDEALSRRSVADENHAIALTERVRLLMRPRQEGDDFQVRYDAAIQESPDVVILQCRIEQLLS